MRSVEGARALAVIALLIGGTAPAAEPKYGKVDTFEPGKKYTCVPTADHKGWDCNEIAPGSTPGDKQVSKAPSAETTPQAPATAARTPQPMPATPAPAAPSRARAGTLPAYLRATGSSDQVDAAAPAAKPPISAAPAAEPAASTASTSAAPAPPAPPPRVAEPPAPKKAPAADATPPPTFAVVPPASPSAATANTSAPSPAAPAPQIVAPPTPAPAPRPVQPEPAPAMTSAPAAAAEPAPTKPALTKPALTKQEALAPKAPASATSEPVAPPQPAPVAPTSAPRPAHEPIAAPPAREAAQPAPAIPSTPAVNEPAPGPAPSGARGIREFLALAGADYVIELAHGAHAADFAALRDSLQLTHGQLYELHLRSDNGDWWLLVWASFDSVDAARAARAELPADAAINAGWPRRIGALQSEARRVSSNQD